MARFFFDPAKVSFYEDSTQLDGERVIELLVGNDRLQWLSTHYSAEHLDKISDHIFELLDTDPRAPRPLPTHNPNRKV